MEDKIVHDYAVITERSGESQSWWKPWVVWSRHTHLQNRQLESGKHFATSNKALIAEKGAELHPHCKGKKCELHV